MIPSFFEESVPRKIENIFSDFETNLSNEIHEVEYRSLPTDYHLYPSFDRNQYIIDNKELETIFSEKIEDFITHLIEQFKTYSQIQLVSFIHKQKISYNNYLPEKRKRNIYNRYLVDNLAHGNEKILQEKINLSESHKAYLRHIYTKYNIAYNNLKEATDKLFYSYITVIDEVVLIPETKTEKLKAELTKYGLFDLEMIAPLSDAGKTKLLELISSNGLPYCIAMFDYLGLLQHLEKEYFPIKETLQKEIAKWFELAPDGRGVKGNINSLIKNTSENLKRYTAYKHKQKVKTDYQQLK